MPQYENRFTPPRRSTNPNVTEEQQKTFLELQRLIQSEDIDEEDLSEIRRAIQEEMRMRNMTEETIVKRKEQRQVVHQDSQVYHDDLP